MDVALRVSLYFSLASRVLDDHWQIVNAILVCGGLDVPGGTHC
jgi:hypothetical protein